MSNCESNLRNGCPRLSTARCITEYISVYLHVNEGNLLYALPYLRRSSQRSRIKISVPKTTYLLNLLRSLSSAHHILPSSSKILSTITQRLKYGSEATCLCGVCIGGYASYGLQNLLPLQHLPEYYMEGI